DSAAVQTRAVLDGDAYVLNGSKRFITNAGKAHLFTVMARTNPDVKGGSGVSAFLVPRDLPGLTVGKSEKKMGQQGAHIHDVIFENVRVPVENRLGGEGEGFKVAMQVLDRGRLHISSVCVGVAERLIADCVAYANERKQFGKPIAEFQLIQGMIADSKTEALAARALMLETARKRDAAETVTLEA
ncbi:acyl-CoA dehydrogenase family protein, partial [Colwellia sp. RSH04]|uniref:acyl-CoA dehydrogenase family protein n=1 Tax=Colwellia sp. RSH04 TaxID=2305464 RepID=UPI000EC17B1D